MPFSHRCAAWLAFLALSSCARAVPDDPTDASNDLAFDVTPADAPVDAAPVDAAPVDAAPVDAAPVDAAPVDAAPVDAAPVDAPTAPCGDGFIDRAAGEVCDDGNQVNGDACAADCRSVLCDVSTRTYLDPTSRRCYWRETDVLRRDAAIARCAARGGALVAFESEAEMNAVYPSMGLSGSGRAWIALQLSMGMWFWDSGPLLAFRGFRGGEPSGDGTCVEWGPTNNFNDIPCDVNRDFVCERAPPGRPR